MNTYEVVFFYGVGSQDEARRIAEADPIVAAGSISASVGDLGELGFGPDETRELHLDGAV